MDSEVFEFKWYEDSSLSYTGINKYSKDKCIDLYDTMITAEDCAIYAVDAAAEDDAILQI